MADGSIGQKRVPPHRLVGRLRSAHSGRMLFGQASGDRLSAWGCTPCTDGLNLVAASTQCPSTAPTQKNNNNNNNNSNNNNNTNNNNTNTSTNNTYFGFFFRVKFSQACFFRIGKLQKRGSAPKVAASEPHHTMQQVMKHTKP